MTTDTNTAQPAPKAGFLSIAEAADEIGCTRRFLETRIEDGEIAVFKPSARLIRIRRSALEQWIETYTRHAKAAAA